MMRMIRRILGWGLVLLVVAGVAAYVFLPMQIATLAIGAERAAAGLELRSAEIPGFHIAYLEGGSGEPLLLIHGIGAEKDNWARLAKSLTPHYHVIALDLPGFGDSSRPEDVQYRIDDQVERVHAFVHKLGLKSVHVGGNSMGGWIAGNYAVRYPQEVASLWLLDPAGVVSAQPSEMIERMGKGEPVPIFARDEAEFDQVMAFVFAEPPFIPTPVKRAFAKRAAAYYPLNMKILGEIRTDSVPFEKLAKGLQTPTLIVWGDQDRVLHVSGAEVLHRLLPNSQVVIMHGVGHVPMLENPKQTADDYLAFRSTLKP